MRLLDNLWDIFVSLLKLNSRQKKFSFLADRQPVFTLPDSDQGWSVTRSSDFSVCLIVQVAKQTHKLGEFSAVQQRSFQTKRAFLCCTVSRSSLFVSQKSTQSKATVTATPATSPSSTMASGSTTAPAPVGKTATSGAPQPPTTARTSVGASVP